MFQIKKGLWKDITALGGTFFYTLLTLLTLVLHLYPLAKSLIIGFIFTGIIITLARIIYFKHRPKKREYTNFIERIDASAFPSWHAARIIFLSLTLHTFFQNIGISIILTIVSILVCYSRIYLQKHDWIDLIAGIILGVITFGITNVILL